MTVISATERRAAESPKEVISSSAAPAGFYNNVLFPIAIAMGYFLTLLRS